MFFCFPGALDQSFFGNGPCFEDCVTKRNATVARNTSLWLLKDSGVVDTVGNSVGVKWLWLLEMVVGGVLFL
jgi:hypothetical protein